jgi:hypothetical protein
MPDLVPTVAAGVLARRPRDLDRGWAQRVLDGVAPGVAVLSVEAVAAEVGTTTRARLVVDHDGPDDLPRRWFVKLPSGSWKARAITALPRLPQTEVRFYAEVARRLSAPRPRALAAASRFGRGYTLVIEDVTETGARPGRSGEAVGAEDAAGVVELLADVHAALWEDAALDGELAWLAGPVRRLEDGLGTALAVPLMRRGLARAGDAVPDALRAPAIAYARRRRRAMELLADGPRTLIHHDPHPGNLYWRADGSPGLLDWQLVRVGEGVGDLAYFLATALAPEVRREAQGELLAHYGDALRARGVTPREDLEERLRAHLTYAFEAMVVTLAVGDLMEDAVAEEMVRRTAAAVADADAFGAVL